MKIKRLKGRDLIRELFAVGKSTSSFPLYMRYNRKDEIGDCLIGISVPKKALKRAVDRNRVKRQLWAILHKNQDCVISHLNQQKTTIMIVYCSNSLLNTAQMESALLSLIDLWKENTKK